MDYISINNNNIKATRKGGLVVQRLPDNIKFMYAECWWETGSFRKKGAQLTWISLLTWVKQKHIPSTKASKNIRKLMKTKGKHVGLVILTNFDLFGE